MSTLAERLQLAMAGPPKVSQRALAAACGIAPPSVNDWLSGKTKQIEGGNLLAAAKRLGVNPLWLARGVGHMRDEQTPGIVENPRFEWHGQVEIPHYQAEGGELVLEEEPPGIIKSWRVDEKWLRLNVRHHTGIQNLRIVTAFGPSMQPEYNPGDPLLMDRGVRTVETEGIFFFQVENHGFIRQLQRIPTESGLVLRAKSLNPSYDSFDITGKMNFQVLGKILTVWKSKQV